MTEFFRAQFNRGLFPVIFFALFLIAVACSPGVAQAVIVYTGTSSGANNGLPTNGTAGTLTINKPAGTVAGQALIASIAARPSGMTVTVPPNWFPMTVTQQPAGGVSTLPGGMTLLTYYHIVGLAEPANYAWTFANPVLGTSAGSAVGGLLAFSGIDTSGGNPINVWSDRLTASGTTHSTTAITPTVTNTMIVSSISYLSGDSFANPTGIGGLLVERLDQRAPAAVNAVGTTLQMSTAPWATVTATGSSQAIAASNADTGVGHLMALKPADIDPGITMTRSGPLNPGGSASYTLTVTNNGIKPEPGPISVVNTLPAGLTYNATGSGGTGWVCSVALQVVTCTRAGALAAGAPAAALVINVNVNAGALGTLTNTATVSGTGGDGNMANNTATDSYTLAVDLALTMISGVLNPGQNGTYTIDVSNIGTLTAPSPVTVTDTLPAGLTFVSGAGTGWVCSAIGQIVTCTRASSLGNGVAAGTLTLTVAVGQTTFAITNSATVAGTGDSNLANNTASVAYSVASDLSLTMTRGANLVPGTNATYTLNVSNAGPNSAPQPITITDTLPAGLTYVSGVGAGWACAVGPPVTCTRSGTLASGASSSLVLTVAVSAGASGTITHTATVAGTAVDGSPANNTASDSYTIALSTYAYYKMDEASWTGAAGEVLDSSGNNRNASRMGGGTVDTVAAPASGLKGNTCRAGSIPVTAGSGVSTGIDVNNGIGNSGTISFWYKSNTAWNDGNDRMLFDASNNLGNGGADKHFYLVKGDGGQLRFALEDDNDDDEMLSSGGQSFLAGEWHHIAVTWDWVTSRRMYLYLDGVAVGNNTINDNIGNYSTLLIGLAQTGIGGTDTDYTTNTANGVIDEVRIYTSALTATQITADMNATHACGVVAPDHIRIEHDGSAISCSAEAVVVKACANAACSILYTGGVTGILTAGSNSVAFAIASGQSQTTANIHLPTSSALTDPQTVRLGAGSVSPVPTDAASPYCSNNGGAPNNTTACDVSVSRAGFLFDVPHLISGAASGAVNISAVRSSDSSTCVPLFNGVTRTVAFWGQYQNPVTGTLPLQVNGSNIETTTTPAYTSTYALAFGATGVASLTSVQYDDVGLMQLNARYVGDATHTPPEPPDVGMIVTGSDTFVVKPHHFDLSGIQQTAAPNLANPGATDAAGNKFVKAGEPFTVTVTAKNALGGTTANYGQETTPESVRFVDTSLLSTAPNYAGHGTLVTGLGLTNNLPISGSFGDFGTNCAGFAGTAGTACGTDFTWNEVGIIKLTPSVGDADYLGAGDAIGTTSGNVGRFYPDHFAISLSSLTAACVPITPLTPFSYFGQDGFTTAFTLTAQNASNGTTENYIGAFAKLDLTNYANYGFSAATLLAGSSLTSSATAPSGTWTNGVANVSARHQISRPTAPSAEILVTVSAAPADGEVVAAAASVLGSATRLRYGRLRMLNGYGSELLALPVFLTTEFLNAAGFYVRNTDDSCTSLPVPTSASGLVFGAGNLSAGETTASINGAAGGNGTVVAGNAGFVLTRPGPGNNGYVDITIAAPSWLTYPWTGIIATNPAARATFGIYKSPSPLIYRRENY